MKKNNSSSSFNVIFVTSRTNQLLEDDLGQFSFFLLNEEREGKAKIVASVEELAVYMGTTFEHVKFLGRLIPRKRDEIVISETEPTRKGVDAIVTDLFLRRSQYSQKLDIFGIGIVAWAVQHGIPVGLIAEDYDTHPQYAWVDENPYNYTQKDELFWIDSVLDTFRTDSRYKLGEIPVGDVREVCCNLRRLLLKSTTQKKIGG